MAEILSCPNEGELNRLLRGDSSPDAANAFAEHLEECVRCADAVDSSLTGDTLAEALQAQATPLDTPPRPLIQALIQRLGRLRPEASAAPPSAVGYSFLAPPQAPDEMGRLGCYRILTVLGSGGMGVVFQAEDLRLKRRVALKVMRPEIASQPAARERFLREAQAVAALEHDHIVSIYQVGEEGGVPFLAMPCLKGSSLEEWLQRGTALSVPQVLRLGRQIARGLAAAHTGGVIHRDIKPANLWLEPEQGGRIKILDFGLARVLQDNVHLTGSRTIVGTPAYLSPEQANGDRVDHRADLFSLGVVLYRMLTGELPFRGNNTLEILAALCMRSPRPLRDLNAAVPPVLAELVMQLLAKDPVERPASAQAVADLLYSLERQPIRPAGVEQAKTEAVPPSLAPESPEAAAVARSRGAARRHRGPVVAAVAVLVLMPLGYFFGGAVLRFATNKGELVVQVDARDIEIAVKQNGVVVQDRTTKREFVLTAGDGEIEVYEKASGLKLATKKFTLTRGGKQTVAVELKPTPQQPALVGGNDRKAAEWVLSLGGRVVLAVDDTTRDVGPGDKLPEGVFQLREVNLKDKKPSAAGLGHLENLKDLQSINLWGTGMTDAGMRHLGGLTKLHTLWLNETPLSDIGLKHLQGLTNLTRLELQGTRVSNAGLVHLRGMTKLQILGLDRTRVTDVGLKGLAPLKDLQFLGLEYLSVSDAGLEHLRGLTNLLQLGLHATLVNDDGMKLLKSLTKLQNLGLSSTQVGDAGLKHLQGLTDLQSLPLMNTRVTDAGLAHLKNLTKLGVLYLNGRKISDVGLEHLQGLTSLRGLTLENTRVTDTGLKYLEKLTKLTYLGLQGTRLSNGGLVHLKGLEDLQFLDLRETRVSDEGLQHLYGLEELRTLDVRNTKVTTAGVAALHEALPKCRISADVK